MTQAAHDERVRLKRRPPGVTQFGSPVTGSTTPVT